MNKPSRPNGKTVTQSGGAKKTGQAAKEITLQEGPIERALRLSSDHVIAMAIRELIKKDELN